jgi:LysM repeat protein/predicted nucleic acid-binding Zn ribbon protein
MAAMTKQQISPAIAERRCPNCGTRVARDAESCFMCGHDLRIQKKRRQRVSWIDALLVLAVLVVLAVWWRIASQPRPEVAADEGVAAIFPTNIPMLTATVPISVVLGLETPTPLPTVSANGVIRHRVREGETLVSIATLYGVTVEEIQAANNLADALIRTGDELIVPVAIPESQVSSGSTVESRFEYTVQAGDTIISIANRFGSTVEEIVIANSLTANDFILPGDVLMIPVREVPAEVLASTEEGSAEAAPGSSGVIYAEPRPIGPANEEVIGADQSVLLRWVSVDVLAPNEWYVLLIYPISGPAQTFPSIWTKTTSYNLDAAFAPTTGEAATYAWQVSVVRVMPGISNQYALEAASPPSELRSFTWR